jgi:hypothetical protein
VGRFKERDDTRMFYVYHTAKAPLAQTQDNVLLVGPERLAEMTLESGLFDWLLRKAG